MSSNINYNKNPTFLGITFLGWYCITVIALLLLFLCSCSSNRIIISDKESIIFIPKNEKITLITKKDNILWYETVKRDSIYSPKVIIYNDKSNPIIFIEN